MITLSRLPWFDLWLFKNLLIVFQNCDLLWKPPKSLHTSSEKESVSFTDIFWFDSDSLGETYGKQIKTSDIKSIIIVWVKAPCGFVHLFAAVACAELLSLCLCLSASLLFTALSLVVHLTLSLSLISIPQIFFFDAQSGVLLFFH